MFRPYILGLLQNLTVQGNLKIFFNILLVYANQLYNAFTWLKQGV